MKNQYIEFVEGREYVTKDGRVVKLVCINNETCYFDGNFTTYLNGYQNLGGFPISHNDIIAEYKPMSKSIIDFSKPVQTKDGRKATIFTTQARGEYPVVGQIEGCLTIFSWGPNGKYGLGCNTDLINVKEKKVVLLGPEDIKVGDIVKYKNEENAWQMIVAVKKDVNGNHYFVAGNSNYYLDKKISNLLLSHDNGKTWQNFEKEIEA